MLQVGVDLSRYALFAAAVQHGSITAAAAALGLARPTLSRQLAALEEGLGLALLHRSTRQVQPTAAGRRLYEQITPLLEGFARVRAGLLDERDEISGLLRVSVPPVLAPELGRLLVQLGREHPRLSVELLADIRWADLRRDGIDVAVRAGRVIDKDLVQHRLGATDVSAVASPGYLARRGAPAALADLAAHQLLRGHGPDGTPQRWWPLRGGGRVPVDGAFACNDQRALQEAALADGGVALLDERSAARALADGRLVRVLAPQLGTRLQLHAVFTRRTLQPARVRAFVEALTRWYAALGGAPARGA